jgi:hypothetical protein
MVVDAQGEFAYLADYSLEEAEEWVAGQGDPSQFRIIWPYRSSIDLGKRFR